jgi:uncharacterized integral membrane protein
MASFYLVLGLIFSLLIAIIALANNELVTVSYIVGRVQISLILLILGSAVTGALAMGLFSIFRSIRNAFAFRELRNQQVVLQKKVKALEEEKVFLLAELNRAVSVPEEEDEISESESEIRQEDLSSGVEEVEEEPS